MTAEYLLQLLGTLAIYAYLLAEVVLALVGCFKHCCQGILGTVAGS